MSRVTKQDQVNNANSAFILINHLISQGFQSVSIGRGGPGSPGGLSGPGGPGSPGGASGPYGPGGPGGSGGLDGSCGPSGPHVVPVV